jgi:stearoyl-CoA desaturase (delta-9 desaturase)
VPLAACHLSLFALPWIEVDIWTPLQLYVGAQLIALTLTMALHRYFAHRTFKTSRWFQFALAVYACHAMQGGPLWWAQNHRVHHSHSDEPGDPHSPVVYGMWHSYIGWIFEELRYPDRRMIHDLTSYPELRWLERVWMLPGFVTAGTCYWLMGLNGLIFAFCIPVLILFHSVCSLNSFGHRFGSQRFETGDGSRNNWVLGILTMGDGWHNNHHRAPYAARTGFAWYEVDLPYYVIWVMARLRLVWDVKPPSEEVMAQVRGVQALT